jgi:hypothetical protein
MPALAAPRLASSTGSRASRRQLSSPRPSTSIHFTARWYLLRRTARRGTEPPARSDTTRVIRLPVGRRGGHLHPPGSAGPPRRPTEFVRLSASEPDAHAPTADRKSPSDPGTSRLPRWRSEASGHPHREPRSRGEKARATACPACQRETRLGPVGPPSRGPIVMSPAVARLSWAKARAASSPRSHASPGSRGVHLHVSDDSLPLGGGPPTRARDPHRRVSGSRRRARRPASPRSFRR